MTKGFMFRTVLIFIAAVVILGVPFCCYIIGPNEYAALFKFGKIVSVSDTPGIKFMMPGVNTVRKITKKLHLYDIPRSGVITKDKKSMSYLAGDRPCEVHPDAQRHRSPCTRKNRGCSV